MRSNAVKISFANEIGALSASLGVDGREVMDTVCKMSSSTLQPPI